MSNKMIESEARR